MTTRKKMRKDDLQTYKKIRNQMVSNQKKKEEMYNEEMINTLFLNLHTHLRRVSLEILILFWRSRKKEIRESLTNKRIQEKTFLCLQEKKEVFTLRALRIFIEDDSALQRKYSFIYKEIVERSKDVLEKEEAFLFFQKHRVSHESVLPFVKSKSGLSVLSNSLEKYREEDVYVLLKEFKRVDVSGKIIILRIIKRLIVISLEKEESERKESERKESERKELNDNKSLNNNKLVNELVNELNDNELMHKSRNKSLNNIKSVKLNLLAKFFYLVIKVKEREQSLLLLAQLAENSAEIQKEILSSGLLSKICDIMVEEQEKGIENPSLYYCLYAITGLSEESRKYITKNHVLGVIFHHFNTKTVSKVFDISFLTLLYLFRSLTRSVCFLRSDLLDYPMLDACISALISIKEIEEERDIYCLIEKKEISSFNLVDQILNVISNLVLDYGNYKAFFYQKKALKKTLALMHHFPVSTLFLLKNFVYDSCLSVKEYLLTETEDDFFTKIFSLYFHKKEVVEQSLNLIRNLFCETDLEMILNKYKDILDLLINNEDYILSLGTSIVEHYLYIFVNMAIHPKSRRRIIDFIDINKLSALTKTRDLQVAMAWLITNLTWKEYEDYQYNVRVLEQKGVFVWLKGCRSEDPLLCEKLRTAFENLCK